VISGERRTAYRMFMPKTIDRVIFSWKSIWRLQKMVEGIKARLASTNVLYAEV